MAKIINSREFMEKVENTKGVVMVDFLQIGVVHVRC